MVTIGIHVCHRPGCKIVGSTVRMLILLVFCDANSAYSQPNYSCLRVYMDNDYFAFRKKDGAYTNGLRVDYWRRSPDNGHSKIFKSFKRKLCQGAIHHHGFSMIQTMFTANSTSHSERRPGDYPYSGALIGMYSENVLNTETGNTIQLDYIGGVMGPHSFAAETQTGFHKMIGDRIPAGWDNQLPTALLLNINVTFEGRMLNILRDDRLFARIGLKCGTLLNAVSVSLNIHSNAKRMPAFVQLGAISGRRFQCHVYFVPEFHFVYYNALLQGAITREKNDRDRTDINHFVFTSATGLLLRYEKFGMSFTYKSHSGLIRHQPHKTLGNVSLYFLFRE